MLEMPRLVGAPGSSGEGEEGRKSERVAPPGIGLCSRREPEQLDVLGNITEDAQPKPIYDMSDGLFICLFVSLIEFLIQGLTI